MDPTIVLPAISGALLPTGALVLLRALVLSGTGERAELELATRHNDVAHVAVLLWVAGLRLRTPEVTPA